MLYRGASELLIAALLAACSAPASGGVWALGMRSGSISHYLPTESGYSPVSIRRLLPAGYRAIGMVALPGGHRLTALAAGASASALFAITLQGGGRRATAEVAGRVSAPNGAVDFAANPRSNTVYVLEPGHLAEYRIPPTGAPVRERQVALRAESDAVFRLVVSPDGRAAYVVEYWAFAGSSGSDLQTVLLATDGRIRGLSGNPLGMGDAGYRLEPRRGECAFAKAITSASSCLPIRLRATRSQGSSGFRWEG